MNIQGSMLRVSNRKEEKGFFNCYAGNQEKTTDKNRKTIFVGKNTADQKNSLAEKKKEAQKKASNVIRDAFEEELALDEKIAESQDKIDAKKEQIQDYLKQIQELEEEKEQRKSTSSEEGYAAYCSGISKMQGMLRKEIKDAQKGIDEENESIKSIKKAKLQSTNIQDALNEADDIMKAARDEIIHAGAVQIKENMDEYIEEKQEEAKKKAEKREEKEEQREEMLEQREEHQPTSVTKTATETLFVLDQLQSDKNQELQNILQEYSLTTEDIKGTAVDAAL